MQSYTTTRAPVKPPGAPPIALRGHAHVPPELTAGRQCVAWRWEKRDGKLTKPPINPHTGRHASVDDASTWGTHAEALQRVSADSLPGWGRVLTPEDGLTGFDLDKCVNPETGDVELWAMEIVRAIDSYTQVSPSGTGLRIFAKGTIPAKGRRKGPLEVYTSGRYLTVTEEHLPGTPTTIEERQDVISSWFAATFPPPAAPAPSSAPARGTAGFDDAEVVRRCEGGKGGEAFRRLFFNGDTSAYGGDDSSADLALCSRLRFYSGDSAQVDRLFRRSALYRPKWEREDYRASTLAKAMAGDVYTPPLPIDLGNRTNGHAAPPSETVPMATPPSSTAPARFNLTDYGNAERLVAQHGEDLRFCHPRNKWLVWDGKRWAEDATAEVARRAKSTVRSIYQEAAAAAKGGADDEAKGLAKHAMKSEARQRLEAAIMLAASEKGIPVLPEELDVDLWALNCPNGTLNLRTGTLRPHRREDYLTKLAGVAYDAAATCPTWQRFLESVLPDPDVRRFVQRAAGYSLAGDTRERILLLLHGVGRNGKSTFLETVNAAVGEYGSHTAAETLLLKRPGGIPNDIARLKGARFVSTGETDEGRRLAEALIKEITGNDTVTARFMHAEFFDFKPQLTLWLATNHRPEVRGTDKAIWDRIKLVPFEQRFWLPPEEGPAALRANTTLPARLLEELPGILAWLVRGCLDWQRDGLGEPQAVTEATAAYRAEEDVVATFLEECCIQQETALVTAKSLYAAYKTWTEHGGEKPLTQTMFGRRLTERGLTRTQLGRDRAHTWIGLGLRIEESTPQGAKERV